MNTENKFHTETFHLCAKIMDVGKYNTFEKSLCVYMYLVDMDEYRAIRGLNIVIVI